MPPRFSSAARSRTCGILLASPSGFAEGGSEWGHPPHGHAGACAAQPQVRILSLGPYHDPNLLQLGSCFFCTPPIRKPVESRGFRTSCKLNEDKRRSRAEQICLGLLCFEQKRCFVHSQNRVQDGISYARWVIVCEMILNIEIYATQQNKAIFHKLKANPCHPSWMPQLFVKNKTQKSN